MDTKKSRRFQPQDFTRLTFHRDFERPTAHFTIRREPLLRDAGIDGELERLPAERALDSGGSFHENNS